MTTETITSQNVRTATDRYRDAQAGLLAEYGVAAQSYLIGADTDQPVHVLEAGSGDPIVLIHGGGSSAAGWVPLLQHLQRRFRCLAVDRPGHGLSYRIDYRKVPDYRADAAAFVERTLDLLGLERATLVGNSMGGFFALAFALAHPGRVERLALIGAPAGLDRPIPGPLRALGLPVLGPLLWKTVARPSEGGLRDFYGKYLVADADRLSPSTVACGVAAHRLPGAAVGWLSVLRRFTTLRGIDERCYLRDELPEVAAPTLFVWGDRDRFAPPSSGQAASQVMPDARVEVIPGAGHLPWHDEPARCATVLADYLAASAPA